jgi:hypothetical protein
VRRCRFTAGARGARSRRRGARPVRRFGVLPPPDAWQDSLRTSEKTALRSLAMEFTAIIVFTAIALWFATEVGGENL